MKSLKYIIMSLAAGTMLSACNDEDWAVGNPVMEVNGTLEAACFGDSLEFTVKATDVEVPLSTLKAELYFGEELVSNTTIRTKVSGEDYTGKIYVPYLANIPDGRAVLRLQLQNINFTTSELFYEVPISHASYPYLTFVSNDGDSYTMTPSSEKYTYEFTGTLPQSLKGYIVAPKTSTYGNDITFGYVSNQISVGAESAIPFSNSRAGNYTISFNTYTFEGSPFVVLALNDSKFESISDEQSQLDIKLTNGQAIEFSGFPNFEEWSIDADYLTTHDDGTITFNAKSGTYRFIADMKLQYFRIYTLNGNNPASLNSDGSGAVWAIGENIGKPSLSANTVGWTTEKALCLAPIADKVYQLTLVAGKSISAEKINFKFFGEMGWGDAFTCDKLTSTSDLVLVGDGVTHDDGNLYLADGKSLEPNGVYVFTVDLSAGASRGILSVEYKGEQAFEEQIVYIDGQKMTTSDNELYTLKSQFTQGNAMSLRGMSDLSSIIADPDFFTLDADKETLTLLSVSGAYTIKYNRSLGIIQASKLNDSGEDATIDEGAIWLMGWGVGSPSLDSQFGWTPGAAYCMSQVSPGIYRFTGYAGPEKGSVLGMRYRYDYMSFKFFHQNGWGGEFGASTMTLTDNAKKYLKISGNIELADGVNLTIGGIYVMTLDITAGKDNAVLDFVKL